MLHKIQHARSGGVLHGAHPGWLRSIFNIIIPSVPRSLTVRFPNQVFVCICHIPCCIQPSSLDPKCKAFV